MATRTLVNTETRLRGKRDHYTSSRSTNAGTVGSAKSSPRNNVDSKTRRATASPGKEDVSGRTNAHSRFTGQQNKNSTSEITSRGRAEERTKGRKNSKASDGSPVSVSKLKNLFDKTIADEQEKAKSSFRPVRPHSQFVSEKTKKSQDSDRWSLPSYAKKSGPPSHKIYVSEGILAKRAKFAADSIEDIALKTHSPRLSDLVPDFDLNDFNKDFRSRSKSDSWIKPLLKANTNADKSRSSSAGASERVSRDDSFSRKAIPKHRLIKSKSADTLDVDDSVFESELGKGFSKGVKEQVQRHRNKVAMGRKGLDDEKKGDHQPNKLNGSSAENAVRSEKKKYVIINKSDDKENNSTKTKKKEKQPWERESGVVKRATWFDEEISDSEKTMELESVHLDVKVEQKTESRSSDRTKTVQSAVNEKKIEKEKKEERQPGESHSEVRQKYKTEEKPKYVIEHKTDIKSDLHVESKPKVEIENKIEDKFDVQVSHSHTDTRQEPVFIPQKEVEDEEDAQSSGDESDGSMVEHSSQEEDGNFYSFLDVASNLERKPTASVLVKEPKKEKKVQKVGFSEVTPQVCATYSPLDYERGNDLIDPVTASAEWELEKRVEKMDVFSVDLDKDNKGLGLSIIGLGVGTDTGVEKLGIFVKSLTGNGAAEKDGRIQVNDQIIEVDGVSLVGVTQQFAAQTLKHTSGTVRFLMGREKGRLHHMKSTDSQLAKEIEDLKTQLQQAEERASKAEEKAKDAMNQVASLKADAPKTPKSKATKDSKQVSKLEEQLKKMTEAVKESETDLALSEAENQDLLKQLEESKGLYLILEKKYQTKKE